MKIDRAALVSEDSLDVRKPQLGRLHAVPASNGVADGPWSGVPLWRGLDSAFLCSPAIPKAPAAPRVKIEMVGRTLRISDDYEDIGLAVNKLTAEDEMLSKFLVPTTKLLLMCASVGFLGGIAVAWLFGVFG